ncbi:MAG: hypothetical protein ACTHJK_07370, partial [Sphingomicrobium sp.]
PHPKPADAIPPGAATQQFASALISDDPKFEMTDVEKAAEPASPLAIDSSHGTLIADAQPPATAAHKPKASSECPASGSKQITALSANDLRSGVSASGC